MIFKITFILSVSTVRLKVSPSQQGATNPGSLNLYLLPTRKARYQRKYSFLHPTVNLHHVLLAITAFNRSKW